MTVKIINLVIVMLTLALVRVARCETLSDCNDNLIGPCVGAPAVMQFAFVVDDFHHVIPHFGVITYPGARDEKPQFVMCHFDNQPRDLDWVEPSTEHPSGDCHDSGISLTPAEIKRYENQLAY